MDEKINIKKQVTFKGETIKAYCYIYKYGDNSNKCYLTDQHLIINIGDKENTFPLQQINKIGLEHRYTMFPLIAGGIILPLSLVAIFNHLYDPWILFYVMIAGGLAFYFGWMGHPVLTVTSKGQVTDTLKLKLISDSLRAFVKFTNEVIRMGTEETIKAPYIYHIIKEMDWRQQKGQKLYKPASLEKEGFIHCSQKDQLHHTVQRFFNGQQDLLILCIDPLKVRAEIRFEKADDAAGLFPHIYGPLNLEAVVEEEAWNDFKF